jgi:sigma-B regulation protein RsbU (phosphoserine phosphatase)
MKRILIIEDEELIRDVISEILTYNGYETEGEANGEKGVARAIEMKPDLILCDVNMPVMNGLQVLEAIKKNEEIKNIPFVFLTALTTMNDLREGMNLGADDYLIKPFDHKELLATISRLLLKADSLKKENDVQLDIVKEQVKGFVDSLDRAKAIQNVILPTEDKMNELFPEHFTFFSPKDIVSGDFYWVRKVGDITLMAVADCTGHGVPGALISMSCYTILNNIIDQFNLVHPAEILKKTNKLFVEFMNSNQESITGDGMDIALCAINNKTNTIQFAGSKRPVYLINKYGEFNTSSLPEERLRTVEDQRGEILYEIKGDVHSIGCRYSTFVAEEQVFEFEKGDVIYLCSDGYGDQFGEISNRKFMSKNLKNFLLSIHSEQLTKQGQLISDTFKTWKGNREQTDDVTVLGIQL